MKKLLAFLLLILVLVACSSSPNPDGGDDNEDSSLTFTATVITPEGSASYSNDIAGVSYNSMTEMFHFIAQPFPTGTDGVHLFFQVPGPDLPPEGVNLLKRDVTVGIAVIQGDPANPAYEGYASSGTLTLNTSPERLTVTFNLHFVTDDDIPVDVKGQFSDDTDY